MDIKQLIKELREAKTAIDNGTTGEGFDLATIFGSVEYVLNELESSVNSVENRELTGTHESDSQNLQDITRTYNELATAVNNARELLSCYSEQDIKQYLFNNSELYKLDQSYKFILSYIILSGSKP